MVLYGLLVLGFSLSFFKDFILTKQPWLIFCTAPLNINGVLQTVSQNWLWFSDVVFFWSKVHRHASLFLSLLPSPYQNFISLLFLCFQSSGPITQLLNLCLSLLGCLLPLNCQIFFLLAAIFFPSSSAIMYLLLFNEMARMGELTLSFCLPAFLRR